MKNLSKLAFLVLCSFSIWFAVGLVAVVSQSDRLTTAAALLAFLCTIGLWMTAGIMFLSEPKAAPQEKSKRVTNEDARLALLLQLMDEEDRQVIRQRLLDDLGSDGEAISLADLLGEQSARSQRR